MRWLPRELDLSYRIKSIGDGAWELAGTHVSAVPSPDGALVCVIGDRGWQCLAWPSQQPVTPATVNVRRLGAAAWCDPRHLLTLSLGTDGWEVTRWDALATERLDVAPLPAGCAGEMLAMGWWRPLQITPSRDWIASETRVIALGPVDDLSAVAPLRVPWADPDDRLTATLSPDGDHAVVLAASRGEGRLGRVDRGARSPVARPTAVGLSTRIEHACWGAPREVYLGLRGAGGLVVVRLRPDDEVEPIAPPDGLGADRVATWLLAVDGDRDRVAVARVPIVAARTRRQPVGAVWCLDRRSGSWERVCEVGASPSGRWPSVGAVWCDGGLVVAELVEAVTGARRKGGCRVTIGAGAPDARTFWLASPRQWNALRVCAGGSLVAVRADTLGPRREPLGWRTWLVDASRAGEPQG